jgi:hypothetical protein
MMQAVKHEQATGLDPLGKALAAQETCAALPKIHSPMTTCMCIFLP